MLDQLSRDLRPVFAASESRCTSLIVSDVSVGYGVPQLQSLATSLARFYASPSFILEPDQLERPPLSLDTAPFSVDRLVTANHPYSWTGRHEYCAMVRNRIESLKPSVLVLSSYYPLPALFGMKHRPEITILYQIEHAGEQRFEIDLIRSVMDRIDLIVFPETNRARLDLMRLKPPERVKVVLMLNCADVEPIVHPISDRNERLFYGGTFHKSRTFGDYFLTDDIKALPIDVMGLVQGYDDPSVVPQTLDGTRGGARYLGYAPSNTAYRRRLAMYGFSLVMWNPMDEATLYAAPNKLFDSIACAVPPICAPHPLCVDIIKQFGCGILLDDWSFEGFRDRIRAALRMMGTKTHADMIIACSNAARTELNWEAQFARLRPHLPREAALRS